MAKSINEVTLFGNVGKEPEIKKLDNGVKVATFSLATSTGGYKKADGTEVPEQTQWHNVIAWRGLAEIVERYIRKGDRPIIKGMIAYRSYEKDGHKIYITDIIANEICLTGKKDNASSNAAPDIEIMPMSNDTMPF